MNRIVTTYKKQQDEITIIARRVLECMQNNEIFLPPPPALAELKLVLPEFQQGLVNAMGRDKIMVAIKNDKKVIMLDLLQELADYVTETCKDDRTLMLSSGFDVTSEGPGNNILPAVIEKLEVKLGSPGEATTKVRNVTGARAYIHQYTYEPPTPQTIWAYEACALSSYTFTRLMSEKRCWFRVIAIGSGIQKAYSPVVTVVIQ